MLIILVVAAAALFVLGAGVAALVIFLTRDNKERYEDPEE
jgi:hypothetical protein